MSNPIVELLETLKQEEMTDISNDIEEALKLIIVTVDDVIPQVKKKICEYAEKGDYEKVKALSDIPPKVELCSNYINRMLDELPEAELSNKVSKALNSVALDETQLERHFLTHKATYTKPHHFELAGKRYDLPKQKWRSFIYCLFDIMYVRNTSRFEQFKKGVMTKGNSNCTFSDIPIDNGHRISNSNIYVLFLGSANDACMYAQALLETYDIDIKQLVVYWQASKSNEDVDYDIQIGSRVYHNRLGEGIVQNITSGSKGDVASIKFGDHNADILLTDGKSEYLTLVE